jgi:hypothetical protein
MKSLMAQTGVYGFNPGYKFGVAVVTFSVVAVLAAGNRIFRRVSQFIVLAVDAVVLDYPVKYGWPVQARFIFALCGSRSTVSAILRNYFTKFVKAKAKFEAAYLGIFEIVSEHIAEVRFAVGLSASWFFRKRVSKQAAAALNAAFGQMARTNCGFSTTVAFTAPHDVASSFGLNGVAVPGYHQPSKHFSSQINSLHVLTTGSCAILGDSCAAQ